MVRDAAFRRVRGVSRKRVIATLAALRQNLPDIFAEPQRLQHRHRKGINVLYGHGGAMWVDAKPILKDLNQCADPFTHTYDPFQENIWKILDKQ